MDRCWSNGCDFTKYVDMITFRDLYEAFIYEDTWNICKKKAMSTTKFWLWLLSLQVSSFTLNYGYFSDSIGSIQLRVEIVEIPFGKRWPKVFNFHSYSIELIDEMKVKILYITGLIAIYSSHKR